MIINDLKSQTSNGMSEIVLEQDYYNCYIEKKYSFKKFLFYILFIITFNLVNLILNYSNISRYKTDLNNLNLANLNKESTNIIRVSTTNTFDLDNSNHILYFNISILAINGILSIGFIISKKYYPKYLNYLFFSVSFFSSFNNLLQFQIFRSNIQEIVNDFHSRYTLPYLNCSLIFFYFICIDSNWIINSISFLSASITIYFISIGYKWSDGIEGMILIISSLIFGYFSFILSKNEKILFYLMQKSKNYVNNIENLTNNFNSSTIVIKNDLSVILDKKSKKILSDIFFLTNEKILNKISKIFLFSDIFELGEYFKKTYGEKITNNIFFSDFRNKLNGIENFKNFEETENFLEKSEKEANIILEDLLKNYENSAFEYLSLIKIKISKNSKEIFLKVYIKKNKINNRNSLEFMINDITSIVSVDENNENNKEKNIFLLKLSHEIRGPIVNIMDLVKNIKNFVKINFNPNNNNNQMQILIGNIRHVKNFCKFISSVIDDFEFFSNPIQKKDKQENLNNKINQKEIEINENNNLQNKPTIENGNNEKTKGNENKNNMNIIERNINNINIQINNNILNDLDPKTSNYNINVYNINNELDEKYTSNVNLETNLNKQKIKDGNQNNMNHNNIIESNNLSTNQENKNNNIINPPADIIAKNPQFSHFNLRKLITSTIKIFDSKILLSNKNVLLNLLINPNVPENIVSDFPKIKQILFNIISNSFKFTNAGLISVILLKKNEFLEFTVTDTGIGIQKEYIQYVFEPYFKCEDNPNNIYGAGMGLYIVKSFIDELGGDVNIDSDINSGTTVYFTIPFFIQDSNDYFIKLSLDPSESQIFLEQSTIIKNKDNINIEEIISKKPIKKKKYYSTANVLKDGFLKSPKLVPISSRLNKSKKMNFKEPELNDCLQSTRRVEDPKSCRNMEFNYEKLKSTDNTVIFEDLRENKNDQNEKEYNLCVNDSPSLLNTSNLNDNKSIKLSPITCKRNLVIPMAISKYTTNLSSNKKNYENFKKFRILVVDDELLIRQGTKKIIKKFFFNTFENIEILECEDGFECLFNIYTGLKNGVKYDLILTDETMSFMSGTIMSSIIRSLTQDKILYKIPIYLLTSFSTNMYDENSENIFNGVFPKPINLEILSSIIQALCK